MKAKTLLKITYRSQLGFPNCMVCRSKPDGGFECHMLRCDKGLVSFSPFFVTSSTMKSHFTVTLSFASNTNKTWAH